jgi:hypothetical protein
MSSGEDRGERDVPRRARRSAWLFGALLVVGFIVFVAVSARDAAVPVGGSAPSSMPRGTVVRIDVSMRDVAGRALRLPGRGPGVIVFVNAGGSCSSCVDASRAAAQAIRRTRFRAALTIVSVDSATSRDQIERFARSAGSPPARYVVDDRSGNLSPSLGATSLGGLVVYDKRGVIVGRPDASEPAAVRRALALASAR